MENQRLTAIIDSDSIVWTGAYLGREKPESIIPDLDSFLHTMLGGLGITHYVGYLEGREMTNKKRMFESYKAGRPEKPDFYRLWGGMIQAHLINEWKFERCNGLEADDMCSRAAATLRAEKKEYIVCGIDKDLKQIPGQHYDYKKQMSTIVYQETADYSLYFQTLTGDVTDSIPGLPGIGPVKAGRILGAVAALRTGETSPVTVESPDYLKVIKAYCDHYGEREGLAKFSENFLLVRLQEETIPNFTVQRYLGQQQP